MGTMGQVRTQQGPKSDAVRLELQADCYAGMWAGAATQTQDADGQALFLELTRQDIEEAVAAAEAVGDDRIQQKTQGQVTEESWTHGSAAQRVEWFITGYEQGVAAGVRHLRRRRAVGLRAAPPPAGRAAGARAGTARRPGG